MIYTKIYGKLVPIYNYSNFPYKEVYENYWNKKQDKITRKKINSIYDMIVSFDTESSTILAPRRTVINKKQKEHVIIDGEDYAYTYLWGFDFGGYIIIGRHWMEFQLFLMKINKLFELDKDNKIVVWVHNLSYDFTFMYQFLRELDQENFKIFATDKRKVLYCYAFGFEFRCSYKLTNMGLDKWAKKEKGVTARKLKGTIDYHMVKTPFESLPKKYTRYFVGDLLTTSDCIKNKLINDKRTLWSIPLTSTGYPREETREYCFTHDNKYRWNIRGMTLDIRSFKVIQDCLVGGDTHGNRFYQGRIIKSCDINADILGRDLKSSYPTEIIRGNKYALSNFLYYGEVKTRQELNRCIDFYTCVFYVKFNHIRIKPWNPKSVISISKILECESIDIVDNGRLIEGKGIVMAVTGERFKHIEANYDYKGLYISSMFIAECGYLPKAYRDCTFELFKQKCELEKFKGTPDAYYYEKFKNTLNSLYGMMLTSIVHPEIILNKIDKGLNIWDIGEVDIAEQINKYNKQWNRHLYYPWGLAVVDGARSSLYEMIDCCEVPLYWDTDSCKGFNWDDKKVEAFNKKRMDFMIKNNYVAEADGKKFYLGLAEVDSEMTEFITLGSKKYCYRETDGSLHITVAGVSKKGVEELHDDINNFKVGTTFPPKYAGQCAKFNDEDIHTINIGKKKFITASNCALVDTTYTMKASDDYLARNNFTILEVIN